MSRLPKRTECPKCGLLTNHLSGALGPERCPYDRLVEACGPLELTDGDRRKIRWLAGWDVTDWLCDFFRRLRDEGRKP